MADIQHYERVIKAPKNGKPRLYKVILLAMLVVLLGIWLVISVRFTIHLFIVLLVPILLIGGTVLLWKYTNFEYEYSFTTGFMTCSKIYGSSRRRTIFEGDLKKLRSVVLYDTLKAELSNGDKIIEAIPNINCQNPCVCVFEEDEQSTYLVIDCDEMSAKIFRFFNPSATNKEIFDSFIAAYKDASTDVMKGEENA